MNPDLLKFVQQFYKTKLQAFKGASKIDGQLQNTLQLFVKDVAQAHFQGSGTRLCINLTGPENAYQQVTNSTTKCNPAEARRCAELAKALMEFRSPLRVQSIVTSLPMISTSSHRTRDRLRRSAKHFTISELMTCGTSGRPRILKVSRAVSRSSAPSSTSANRDREPTTKFL